MRADTHNGVFINACLLLVFTVPLKHLYLLLLCVVDSVQSIITFCTIFTSSIIRDMLV